MTETKDSIIIDWANCCNRYIVLQLNQAQQRLEEIEKEKYYEPENN